ncbi:MAG: hypothetical protein FK730_07805 [Asgard group archaeon]|nr:hypothetical protein [Asgard group archaeon]
MSENIHNSEQQNKVTEQGKNSNETTAIEKKKKVTWKSFLRISGLTIVFALISTILMIVGLVLFYKSGVDPVTNAGKWMIVSGVIIFLFTIIFGFEKIEK